MAPYGRSLSPSSVDGFRALARQNLREEKWDFASSEGRSAGSEEQFADEDEDFRDGDSADSSGDLFSPGDYQQLLHPLRTVAERVGREVEQFAEKLDEHNISQFGNPVKKYECTFNLIAAYREIAKGTVGRLRKQHEPKRQQQVNDKWRRQVHDTQSTTEDVCLDGGESEEPSEFEEDEDPTLQTSLEDLVYWQQEADTWRLVESILRIQYPEPGKTKQDIKQKQLDSLGAVNRYSSEGLLWNRFLIEDDLAKERETILQWLKDTAESSGPNIDIVIKQLEVSAERGNGIWTQGWLDTKEATKKQKRLRAWPQTLDPQSPGIAAHHLNSDRTEGLVTQLDPDVVTRQSKVLQKQDFYFERATWLACWEMIRRGKRWGHIRKWCTERMEGWRAVSMRGDTAAWDQIIDGDKEAVSEEDVENSAFASVQGEPLTSQITGNRLRPLWRRMCYALARSGGLDDYERAVYGVLSGDIQSVEKVCRTWDDYLFAHYNSLLIGQFDSYLQANYPDRINGALARKFGIFDSVQYHGEPSLVGRQLIQTLQTHESTKCDAKLPLKVIQGTLIAKQFGAFAYQQGLALSKHANVGTSSNIIPPIETSPLEHTTTTFIAAEDYDTLRVITHLLLIFQDLGLNIGHGIEEVAVENIIVAYIDFLRLAGKRLLIPIYASRLSRERSILTLGRVLIDITNPTERKEQIQLMEKLGIDVPAVLSMQLRLILDDQKSRGGSPTGFAEVKLLEDTASVQHLGRQMKLDFMGEAISSEQDLLIRSLEWYMLLEAHWLETFAVGSLLYRRFLRLGQLSAARALAKRVPFSSISLDKAPALLGRRVDVSVSSENSEEEKAVIPGSSRMTRSRQQEHEKQRQRKSSHRRKQAGLDFVGEQARTYRELEILVYALSALDKWRALADQQRSYSKSSRAARLCKKELERTFDEISAAVEPLLQDWLLYPMDEAEATETERIRNMYLTEVTLAYHSVLHCAGHYLSRAYLIRSLNLATTVAVEGSDIAQCFIAAGRMKELVDAMALTSKAILRGNEVASGRTPKRKRDGSGASLLIWNVTTKSAS